MTNQNWYPIKNFEDRYLINKNGQVKSLKPFRGSNPIILKGSCPKGYLLVTLQDVSKKIKKVRSIHRLLAETFIPNPNNYPVINHKDGNKLNNSLDNLEWCTVSHNNLHAYKNGLNKAVNGEKHYRHILKEGDIADIRNSSKTNKELSDIYSVDASTISHIRRYKRWKNV